MKLNIGSGIYPAQGYINLDIDKSVNPDIVRDITRGLPFCDEHFDEVRAYHFLEHLSPENFLFALGEVYRVLIHGGIFDIIVPLGITDDPTHKIFFTDRSFNVFLDKNSQYYYKRGMIWTKIQSQILEQKYPALRIILQKNKED